MKSLHFKVDDNLYNKIKALADENETSMADIARRILQDGLSDEYANKGIDKVTETIRRVIRSELQPVENRMAKLSAKGAVAAATSMYLNVQAVADMGLSDPVEKYEKSRKKGVAYLRMNTDDEE